MLPNYNLKVNANSSYKAEFELFNEGGEVDISQYTPTLKVQQDYIITIPRIDINTIIIELDASETKGKKGSYHYDLSIAKGDEKIRLIKGLIIFEREASEN